MVSNQTRCIHDDRLLNRLVFRVLDVCFIAGKVGDFAGGSTFVFDAAVAAGSWGIRGHREDILGFCR